MLVDPARCDGTIGGGALEFGAIARAREALIAGRDRFDRIALGPGLGQCCGGAVSLLTEIWTPGRMAKLSDHLVVRPIPGSSNGMPAAVRRIVDANSCTTSRLVKGWFVEPLASVSRPVWIFGAGHVGRAVAATLAPLPEVAVTLVDDSKDRFPSTLPKGVQALLVSSPASAFLQMPAHAHVYVMTYSHALDLEICHQALSRDVAHLGLIGSATKRARFRKRLAELGCTDAQIERMDCPIGDPKLGKHPQEIAVGVASKFLSYAPKNALVSAT
jgi:xanthine dehydrogenase accessory factor